MSTSDEDRVRGGAKSVGGKIKEGVGRMTGDQQLQSEGNLDQAKGKAQQAMGDLKDALKPKAPR